MQNVKTHSVTPAEIIITGKKLLFLSLKKPLNKNHIIASSQAKVKIKGSYKAITTFIYRLQKRPQQVAVESLDIKLLAAEYGRLSADMTITIYLMDDKEKFIDG